MMRRSHPSSTTFGGGGGAPLPLVFGEEEPSCLSEEDEEAPCLYDLMRRRSHPASTT